MLNGRGAVNRDALTDIRSPHRGLVGVRGERSRQLAVIKTTFRDIPHFECANPGTRDAGFDEQTTENSLGLTIADLTARDVCGAGITGDYA